MIKALVDHVLLDRDKFAQGHQRRSGRVSTGLGQGVGIAGANPQPEELSRIGAELARQADPHGDRLALSGEVGEIDVDAFDTHFQGLRNGLAGDAVERGLFLVDVEEETRLVFLAIPVDIDDSGRLLEDAFHLASEGLARGPILPVDFGDERLQHRRPRRHLGHGKGGAILLRDRQNPFTDTFCDGVAVGLAILFREQVHLNISDIGPAPVEIMADEPIEIVGRGRAGVDLIIGHLGLLRDRRGHLAGGAQGLLERRALGQIDDHLELALVVEGQHLHLHEADPDEGHAAN